MRSIHLVPRAILIASLVGLAAAPAAVAVEENEYPVLSTFSAVPHSLGSEGGTVTITVDATDDVGVVGVGATVYFADGGVAGVPLTVTSSGAPHTYSGTVDVPANHSHEPVGHSVEVSATDTAGESTLELMGWIDVEGQPVFDQAPYVFDTTVDPAALSSAGGTVTIGATATDDRSVSEVYAVVTDPVGGQTTLPLDPISADRYESAWTAPANPGTSALAYSVTITALDDIGQPGVLDAGQVTVAATAPPPIGNLEVSRGELTFGPQARGSATFRSFTLTHTGTSAPVSGALVLRARRYVITSPRGSSFTLGPGESLAVTVRYRSWLPGHHHRWLRVSTDDGTRPTLRVSLAGHTIRRS